MSKFSVGDRVKYTNSGNIFHNQFGTVAEIEKQSRLIVIQFDESAPALGWGHNKRQWYCEEDSYLELISTNEKWVYVCSGQRLPVGTVVKAAPASRFKYSNCLGCIIDDDGSSYLPYYVEFKVNGGMRCYWLAASDLLIQKPAPVEPTFQEVMDYVVSQWKYTATKAIELAKAPIQITTTVSPSSLLLASAIRQGLWKPPAPAVKPEDWDCKVAPELFTVAHFLAANYPNHLERGNDIGFMMAHRYKGAVIHVAASPAEKKINPNITQVRAYPNTEANRRLLLEIINP